MKKQISGYVSTDELLETSDHFNYEHITGTVSPSSHVNPGQTFIYEWEVPEAVGPTPEDPDCLTRMYYSASDPIKDTSSGLVGPLLVCRKASLVLSGRQVRQQEGT